MARKVPHGRAKSWRSSHHPWAITTVSVGTTATRATSGPQVEARGSPRRLYDGGIVPDPHGIITGGHANTTARTVAVRHGERINASALSAMFRQIIANNRAGHWRRLNPASESCRARHEHLFYFAIVARRCSA